MAIAATADFLDRAVETADLGDETSAAALAEIVAATVHVGHTEVALRLAPYALSAAQKCPSEWDRRDKQARVIWSVADRDLPRALELIARVGLESDAVVASVGTLMIESGKTAQGLDLIGRTHAADARAAALIRACHYFARERLRSRIRETAAAALAAIHQIANSFQRSLTTGQLLQVLLEEPPLERSCSIDQRDPSAPGRDEVSACPPQAGRTGAGSTRRSSCH